MTETPTHSLARAQEARHRNAAPTTVPTVEVAVALLQAVQGCRYDDDVISPGLAAVLDALCDLIPEPPPYEPHPRLVEAYAEAQRFSTGAAHAELIDLHRAGITVSLDPGQR